MNKIYEIRIHSFVDLITNSSTEIYIQATDKTVESIKQLIDNILKLGGSNYKCEDLFEISLNKERLLEDYSYKVEDTEDDIYDKMVDDGEYFSLYLKVKSKDENNKLAEITSNVLSNLTELFEINASYN